VNRRIAGATGLENRAKSRGIRDHRHREHPPQALRRRESGLPWSGGAPCRATAFKQRSRTVLRDDLDGSRRMAPAFGTPVALSSR
jgi:hypothetical protein